MTKLPLVAMAALFVAIGPASAEVQHPVGTKVEVEGHFPDKHDVNKSFSGIACETPLQELTRTCLVALDERLAAQWVTLTLEPTPKLKVNGPVILFDESKDTDDLHKNIPAVSCTGGAGKFNEHDSEGATFLQGHYVLTGSHGCGRNSKTFKASAFVDVRVPASGTTDSPELTPWLDRLLAETPGLAAAYGQDIGDGRGISIEGVAGSDDTLYFGFRSPVLDEKAPILAVSEKALFSDKGAADGTLHFAKLEGFGVRDLAVLDTDPVRLLVLAGPSTGEGGEYAIFLFSPNGGGGEGESERIADLAVPDGGKAEALLIAARDGNRVRVLVAHDGVVDGDPTLYDLTLP